MFDEWTKILVQRDICGEVLRNPTAERVSNPALVFMPAEEFEKPPLQTWWQIIGFEHLGIDLNKEIIQLCFISVRSKPCLCTASLAAR